FQIDLTVPVERDVPPRTGDLLRADDAPDQTAGVRNDPGKLVRTRPPAHDGERATADLFESNVVFHANALGWPTGEHAGGRRRDEEKSGGEGLFAVNTSPPQKMAPLGSGIPKFFGNPATPYAPQTFFHCPSPPPPAPYPFRLPHSAGILHRGAAINEPG